MSTVAFVWDIIGASDGGGTDEVEDERDDWEEGAYRLMADD